MDLQDRGTFRATFLHTQPSHGLDYTVNGDFPETSDSIPFVPLEGVLKPEPKTKCSGILFLIEKAFFFFFLMKSVEINYRDKPRTPDELLVSLTQHFTVGHGRITQGNRERSEKETEIESALDEKRIFSVSSADKEHGVWDGSGFRRCGRGNTVLCV